MFKLLLSKNSTLRLTWNKQFAWHLEVMCSVLKHNRVPKLERHFVT